MLVEFRLRNFCCFRDQKVLSLVASSDKALPQNVFQPERYKMRLVRSAVVYGPNASGKTKLLDGLAFVQNFVMHSAARPPGSATRAKPFLLDEQSASAPSEFEVTFIHKGVRYQYGFSVDQERVHQEYLYAAPRGRTATYFERQWNEETEQEEYYFGPLLKGHNQRIRQMTRENVLFLSKAADDNHPVLLKVYDWFSSKLMGIQASGIFSPDLPKRDGLDTEHDRIRDLLRYADLGITDYRITEKPAPKWVKAVTDTLNRFGQVSMGSKEDDRWDKVDDVAMIHKTPTGETSLPLELESNGTQQIFRLSPYILTALSEGQTLFIDELDASLHPMIVRALVELFHDSEINKKNAQLLFNTHDTTLLDSSLFRRDQVWFTEKDGAGVADLYALLEYRPRKDESLARGYLQGRYGAIPVIGGLSSFLDEEECQ